MGTNTTRIARKKALTLAGADIVASAAEAEATARGAKVVIAVVDAGGNLIVLRRLDDTQVASVNVGIDKARSAAVFRRPSKVLEDQVREGRVGALQLAGGVALQGGVPITVADQVVGAIGVSGETPTEDEAIAIAGAESAAAFA
jgi:glc operon protein GlcG